MKQMCVCQFVCCFVLVWNLVSHIKQITQAQDIRERGAQKDTWAWKEVGQKLQNDEIHDVYSSPDIKRVIKCWCMRRSRHVARMRRKRNECRVLVGKCEGKKPLWRPRGTQDWCGSGQGQVAGCCAHANENSGSAKCKEL